MAGSRPDQRIAGLVARLFVAIGRQGDFVAVENELDKYGYIYRGFLE